MNCTVFWGNNGFVVVPDCLQASVEAEHRHGPLCACARLRTDRLDAPLAERLAAAIDRRSYSCIGADLALHGDYTPTAPLPLPYGFSWQGRDDESADEPLLLRCGSRPPVLVAELMPVGARGGWIAITSCHKAWAFRGKHVACKRAAAVHFIAAWANLNASRLRSEILRPPVEPPRPSASLRQRAADLAAWSRRRGRAMGDGPDATPGLTSR